MKIIFCIAAEIAAYFRKLEISKLYFVCNIVRQNYDYTSKGEYYYGFSSVSFSLM